MELEMLETFIESTADELRKFEVALEAKVAKDAEIYAHSIKGAAKYTGAKKVEPLYHCFLGASRSLHASFL
jgi:HPt (histidine-containing phosphotransfer) domain-containing protein